MSAAYPGSVGGILAHLTQLHTNYYKGSKWRSTRRSSKAIGAAPELLRNRHPPPAVLGPIVELDPSVVVAVAQVHHACAARPFKAFRRSLGRTPDSPPSAASAAPQDDKAHFERSSGKALLLRAIAHHEVELDRRGQILRWKRQAQAGFDGEWVPTAPKERLPQRKWHQRTRQLHCRIHFEGCWLLDTICKMTFQAMM